MIWRNDLILKCYCQRAAVDTKLLPARWQASFCFLQKMKPAWLHSNSKVKNSSVCFVSQSAERFITLVGAVMLAQLSNEQKESITATVCVRCLLPCFLVSLSSGEKWALMSACISNKYVFKIVFDFWKDPLKEFINKLIIFIMKNNVIILLKPFRGFKVAYLTSSVLSLNVSSAFRRVNYNILSDKMEDRLCGTVKN